MGFPYTFGSARYGGFPFSYSMKGLIYIATNLYNGRSYVGQTRTSLTQRRKQHLRDAIADSVNHFHLALMQYGKEAFEWRILDEFSGSKEEVIHALNVAEEYHILKLKTLISEGGYNATKGGYASDKVERAVVRKTISKPVLQYGKDGVFIREFESITEACRHYGAKHHPDMIGRGIWRGFQWRVKDGAAFPRQIDPYVRPRRCSSVLVYTSEGEFLKEFESINSCKRELGRQYVVRKLTDEVFIQKHSVGSLLVFRKRGDEYPKRIKVNIIQPKYKESSNKSCEIPVLQYTREGVLVREFPSIVSAVKETGINHHSINLWCKRTPPLCIRDARTEYVWQISDGTSKSNIEIIQVSRKHYECKMEHRVIQYSKDGELIKVWKNTVQASLGTADSSNLIRKQCMGIPTRKQTKFIWKFYSPNYPQKIASA